MKIIADKQSIFQEGHPIRNAFWKLTVAHNNEEGPQER